jgi:hypothetical protein
MFFANFEAADEFPNGFGLVAARLVVAGEIKFVEVDHDEKLSEEFALALKSIIIAQRNGERVEAGGYGEAPSFAGRRPTRECVSIFPA